MNSFLDINQQRTPDIILQIRKWKDNSVDKKALQNPRNLQDVDNLRIEVADLKKNYDKLYQKVIYNRTELGKNQIAIANVDKVVTELKTDFTKQIADATSKAVEACFKKYFRVDGNGDMSSPLRKKQRM